MYLIILALTMLILPIGSVLFTLRTTPTAPLAETLGLWFVFWSVGVRLGLAGLRQVVKPEFTARDIFGLTESGALVIVRELGFANLAIGVVGLLAWQHPAFVLPAAIYSTIFYAAAGVMHVRDARRGLNENIAMVSDLAMALLLGSIVAALAL